MQYLIPYFDIFIAAAVFFVGWFIVSIFFRTVVETNKVHIVQSRGRTTSYGTKQPSGNVYYVWPSFVPIIGINRIVLPINNFSVNLDAYDGYDKDRVPFLVHITAFFRIDNPTLAAERVAEFSTLEGELKQIVQGAARRVLASHDINEIMIDRSKFGDMFTQEVATDLTNWGIVPVKNMELMDIQDAHGSKVIANIMAKKASHIEMESRTEVASNRQKAETAEIEAGRTVDISMQDAKQQVGQRTAEKDKLVGIAQQQALQQVKFEEAITKAKEMEVIKVGQVQQAEIDKAAVILEAEGKLEAAKRAAEGVKVNGEAEGAAQQAILMAPVNAQIALADKIENSATYQAYLIAIEAIKAHLGIGTAQAQALTAADIKVIANAGSVTAGVTHAMQLFSGKGGFEIGSMLETLAGTPQGKELLDGIKTRFSSANSEAEEPKCS
ncbi:MAG: SPFH domain-containing protein [Myxococcaceae bacterium]